MGSHVSRSGGEGNCLPPGSRLPRNSEVPAETVPGDKPVDKVAVDAVTGDTPLPVPPLLTTPPEDTSPGDSMVTVDTAPPPATPPPPAPPLSTTPFIASVPQAKSSRAEDMNLLISTLIKTPSDSSTLELLTQMLRPIILSEALKYRTSLPYDTDDYIQEGRILIWKIALRGKYRRGSFKRYFGRAIKFRLSNVFRDYVLRNFVRVGSFSGSKHSSTGGYRGSSSAGGSSRIFLDTYGNGYQVFVESDYAKSYREKHREQCRRSYAKKKMREAEKSSVDKPRIPE